jgi:RHH-type proline utilization regulon transcriptional repressor/proline dehydrogenase/delta 1-pyrroline-5-carboxylate dehydrogenase
MIKALNKVRPELGKHLPLRIGGSEVDTAERLSSVDPSCSSRMVATSAAANAEHVARAVALARAAQLAWWQQGVASRAACLQRAADSVEQRLYELAAWEVYECGKPWREATADIDEAIDFLRYYAREAMRLEQPQGADVPGEQNRFTYLPRGVVGVIAPWNFPLAIISGMAAAALATGNTVLLKPAEQAVAMGHWLWELLTAAGVPANVVQFLPGRGSVTGAAIVEHPHVAMIVFTGSRETGLLINQQAAAASLHAPQVKRVVAEMGGKNAIVVDDSADLDEAVAGVVKSAFGFAGQKCSACSRAIVLPAIYDTFVDRLLAAVHTLRIGPAEDPATDVGPVIDAAARAKVQAYQAVGREEGKELALLPVGPLADQGFFASPAVYGEIQPHHRLAREEIFGPVLAVLRARDFSHALELANDSPFALTGGVYSRTPSHLEQARLQFEVGNLYLNRPITGALVGRQPFGGFRQSGFGSKAGGADYLGQFVLARAVTENTLRRGFAPEATP